MLHGTWGLGGRPPVGDERLSALLRRPGAPIHQREMHSTSRASPAMGPVAREAGSTLLATVPVTSFVVSARCLGCFVTDRGLVRKELTEAVDLKWSVDASEKVP
jgi:hypothetical protein